MLPMPTQPASPNPERPILVVDDDAKIVRLVRTYLERDGFAVVTAADGPAALDAIERHRPALVVLDLMLPELDGRAVIRAVRRDDQAAATPILVISARGSTVDRIAGFEDGADDYLPKPFDFAELTARIRALGRRSAASLPPTLGSGDVTLDPGRRVAFRAGRRLDLSPKEFALLECLLASADRVVSAEELLDRVWDEQADPFTTTVKTTIRRLRAKLGDPPVIQTVREGGYRIGAA